MKGDLSLETLEYVLSSLPVEGCQISQAGALRVEAQDVPSEPSSYEARDNLDVAEVVRASKCGALRIHWAFCACADQPKLVRRFPHVWSSWLTCC